MPGNAVVTVGEKSIEKTDFEHWQTIFARSSGQQQGGAVPDPPSFAKCIAAKRKALPKPKKGQPKTTDAQLKDQCKQEHESSRTQALGLLINAEWIEGEADERGIEVSDAEVKKTFDQQKKQAFPKEADYRKFLKQSGQSTEDVLFRNIRLPTLAQKIQQKITKGKDKVSDAQITDYYKKNKQRFAVPEQRDLRIVLTKGKAKAQQARQALASGRSWKAVTKEYSIDQASKAQGGKLPAVTKGSQEKAFDNAIFKAATGSVQGPVKTQFGYYVFEVTKTKKPSQQSLKEAKPQIKQQLASQGQQKALDAFVKDFQKRWKSKTECRKGFVTQECDNAPKKKQQPGVPPGAVPNQPEQGAPPQQNGQQGAPPPPAPTPGG